jgi:threonine dehydrogenase-like Zn-dependent dehydrogenase
VTGGPKPDLVKRLGAHYHVGTMEEPHDVPYDIVVEATGVGELAFRALEHTGPNGVVALTGISAADRTFPVEADLIGEDMVLKNIALFGSVNANRRHYEQAAQALAAADRDWLAEVITRRVPLDRWAEALAREPDDVKTVITVGDGTAGDATR